MIFDPADGIRHSLIGSVVAFVFTTPVNRWMIARGKGHAVVHHYHHAGH